MRPAARVRGSPGQWAGGVLAAPANGGAPQCRAALLGAAAGGGPWQRRGGDGRSGGAGRTRRPQVSGACGGHGDGRARAGTASPGAGMSGPAAGPGRAEPHGSGHAGRRCPGNTRDSRAALLCAWLFNADVHRLNTCRLNRFCRVSVRSWFLGAAIRPLCPSQWSSGCSVSLSVCLCKGKKGGITEINSADVIGKTAVNCGQAVLERLYACGHLSSSKTSLFEIKCEYTGKQRKRVLAELM